MAGTPNSVSPVLPSPHENEEEEDEEEEDTTPKTYGSCTYHESRPTTGFAKTPGNNFCHDLLHFVGGSVPHSAVAAILIGVVCGLSAWLYYTCLEAALEFLWKTAPEYLTVRFPGIPPVVWIPIVGFTLAVGVGLVVVFLGEPGDLPYTIQCVHEEGQVSMSHVVPMVLASQCSILGGGSLGPEAPLVAICAALGGFLSRRLLGVTERNLLRKHTLMGMAGALAAFFGVPLGGSLFALEVNSRFGIEYYEHTVEAILCGEVCLGVFRGAAGLPIQPIWKIVDIPLSQTDPVHIVYGVGLGLLGALISWFFAMFHFQVLGQFRSCGLLRTENAVSRALVGAAVIVALGMLIPHTMFWGEYEFQTLATLGPADDLAHVWPTAGLWHFEMTNFSTAVLVGVAKLVAISFTVSGGYRGGFIFPLFATGAALGRAVYFVCDFIPVQICVLAMAASLNVAVTRTSLATTLILAYLAGEPNAISSILAASLVSLFATAYMPFIRTQVTRNDLDTAFFPHYDSDSTSSKRTAPDTPEASEERKALQV